MNAVVAVSCDPEVIINDGVTRALAPITERAVFELLADVVLSGELFEDWPVRASSTISNHERPKCPTGMDTMRS